MTAMSINLQAPVGVGPPEGVVSAPVGSIYTDTAATNGAVRWIKATGTGATGWRVLWGDTLWRDITGLLVNGWTATTVRIRRRDDLVYMYFQNLGGSQVATSDTMFNDLGPGWRMVPAAGTWGTPRIPLVMNGNPGQVRGFLPFFTANISAGIVRSSLADVTTAMSGSLVTWPTADPWPATLPGT